MSKHDKFDLDAASQELNAGMDAYRESTGSLPTGDDLQAMEEIVLERNRNDR